ncbi:MAG: type III secretion system chaperone [Pseudomonadota bacterium]
MTREIVDRALHALGATATDSPAILDSESCASLLDAEGWPVLLTYMPGPPPVLVLYAELGEAQDPGNTFRKALESTHLWREGPEFTLGLLRGTDDLTLAMMIAADETLLDGLAPALARFGKVAARWRDILAEPLVGGEIAFPPHEARPDLRV